MDNPGSQLLQPAGEEFLVPLLDKLAHENQVWIQLQVSVDGLMPEVLQGSLGEFHRMCRVNRRDDGGQIRFQRSAHRGNGSQDGEHE